MLTPKYTRRGLVGRITVLAGAWLFGSRASAAELTPPATEGPFYPTRSMRMADIDNDLVRVAGLVRDAGGEVIVLKGRVLSKAGRPLVGWRVEIWQCDVNGRYLHSGDRQAMAYDTGFQGFGHDITRADGSYRFRTIKPTVYPGRTPHIHVKVFDGNDEVLTTQFYLPDDPRNATDVIYRRLSEEDRARVTMAFAPGAVAPEATVDIVV